MVVENIMYFVLGVLVAGLIALIIVPAIWRRAVRLTKMRIEAATPMTMSEFRADKDQLRAEFALSTRRLEQNAEALRRRLADQLREGNRKKAEAATGTSGPQPVAREGDAAEAQLRIAELEKASADLTQKLKVRDRELADKSAQLATAREGLRGTSAPRTFMLDGRALSGDYNVDIEDLIGRLKAEKKRGEDAAARNTELANELGAARAAAAAAAAAVVVEAAPVEPVAVAVVEAAPAEPAVEAGPVADAAPATVVEPIAESAETTTIETTEPAELSPAEPESALVETTAEPAGDGAVAPLAAVAETAEPADPVDALRDKVLGIEATILADWGSERADPAKLRAALDEVAAAVGKLPAQEAPEEGSLAARMQKFVDAAEAPTTR